MLKLLVRITSLGIAVFLSVLAGIYISTAEEAFPRGSEFTASLDFSQVQMPKAHVISELDSLADATGLHLAKVVADPEDFFNSRSLYAFGKEAPLTAQELEWFKPGMHGQLRSAHELGTASLSGPYVYSGSESATLHLTQWLDTHLVKRNISAKDTVGVLQQALLGTGAWLTFLTCLVLLITLVIAWYVLRAKARTLKVLCGTPASKIVLEDLLSLFRVVAIPAVVGVLVALVVLTAQGKASYLTSFTLTSAAFLSCALAMMVLCALLVSALTWPSVDGIASRQPPERHFQRISELLKAATLVLVTVTLPVVGASIAEATNLSNQGAQWEVLKDQVSLRVGVRSDAEFQSRQAELHNLADAASSTGKLTLSYAIKPEYLVRQDETGSADLGGYDGVVIANPNYLKAISPLIASDPSTGDPLGAQGTKVSFDELPATLKDYLTRQFPLWNRAGDNLNGLDQSLQNYRYTGQQEFPALAPVLGEMTHFRNPLVIVVADPAKTFNNSTIGGFLTTANLTFNDAGWVRDYLAGHSLGSVVLSVDRISDAALYNSQLQNQSAGMKTLSFTLVLLALTMSTAVSALVYALSKARRIFVQRTSGWTWLKSLTRRVAWEGALALVLAVAMYFTLGAGARPDVWWALIAVPLYVLISLTMHISSARGVFRRLLSRAA
jgi:hypothetical protein